MGAMSSYEFIETEGAPIKAWTRGVPVEDLAWEQLRNVARLPFIHGHVAAMPDVHWALGATVGSVIPCIPRSLVFLLSTATSVSMGKQFRRVSWQCSRTTPM